MAAATWGNKGSGLTRRYSGHGPAIYSKEDLSRKGLRRQLQEFGIRYNHQQPAPRFEEHLRETLYNDLVTALAIDPFFPKGSPDFRKPLSKQQGSVEGAEYSEAAKGRPCGHVFGKGETVYRCRNCGMDDTCVLCQKCFKASDHDGHDVAMSINTGSGGCCDCGDVEAWRIDAHCAYHYSETPPDTILQPVVPEDIDNNIRNTVTGMLDFVLDVMSNARDSAKPPNLDDDTNPQLDAARSRLIGKVYDDTIDAAMEGSWSTVLWNDEKHNFDEVIDIVKRACKKPKSYGRQVASMVNDRGRATVYTGELREAARIATFLSRIRLGVTVRCARDVFREDMVEVLLEFLQDIANLSVILPDGAKNSEVIRQIICEEICQPWRRGVSNQVGPEKDDRPTVPMEDSDSEDDDDEDAGEEEADRPEAAQEDLEMLDAQDAFTTEAREPELHPDIAAHLIHLTNQQRQVLLAAHNQNRIEAGLPPQTALPMPGNAGQVIVIDQADDEGRNGLEAILELEGQLQPFEVPTNIFGNIAPNTGIAMDDGEPNDEFPTLFPPSLSVDTNRRQINPDHWKAESCRFKELGSTRLTALFLQDLKLWKMARAKLRELYITTMVAIPLFKREMGIRFAVAYKELTEAFLFADREPDQSMILFSVQIFTVPSIAEILVKDYSFITTLLAVCYTYYSQHKIGYPEDVDTNAKQLIDVYSFRSQRHYHIVNDLRYLLCTSAVQKLIPSMANVQAQFIDWLELFQGQNPQQKALRHHVEYESDSWISAFNVTMQIAKHTQMFARTFEHSKRTGDSSDELLRIISMCVDHLRRWDRCEYRSCRPAFEPRVPVSEFISFHHPLHWLLAGLSVHLKQEDDLSFLYASKVDANDVMKIAQYPLRVLHMTWEIRSNLWVRNGHSIRVQLYHYTDVDSREHCIDKDIQFVQLVLASVGCSKRFDGLNADADAAAYRGHLDKHNDIVSAMMKIFKNVPTADWMGEEMNLVHMQEYLFHFFITLFSERSWLLRTSNEDNIARAIRHGLIFGPKTYSEISKFVNDDRGDEACFDKVVEQLTQFTPPIGLDDVGKFILKDSEYKYINPYYCHYTLQQIEEATDIMDKRQTDGAVLECDLGPIDSKPWNGLVDFACCRVIQDYIVKYFTCLRRSAPLNAKLTTSREGVTDKILYFLLLVLQEEQGRRKRGASVARGVGLPLLCTSYFLEQGLVDEAVFIPHQAKLKLLISRILDLDGNSSGHQKSSGKRELALEDRETPETEFAKKKANAKARQAILMNEMRASQAAFIKKHKVDEFDLSDLEETHMDEEAGISSWHYPAGNCMICQTALAANGDSYGILSCVQDSKLDRSTPQAWFCKSAVRDLLSHPLVMDQNYEWHTQGEQGLRAERYRSRDTITTCGHAMHWECYNEFFSAIRTNHQDMINQGRNLPSKIEFQCPLCKTVGNALLPILAKSQEEIPIERVDDWGKYNTFIQKCVNDANWHIDYYNTAESLSETMLANREFVERVEQVSALIRTPLPVRNKAVQSQSEWDESERCFADVDLALAEHTNIQSWTQGCSGPPNAQMPWLINIEALSSSVVDVEVALRDRAHNDNSTTSIVTLVDGMSDQNLVSLRAQAGRIRGALALHYYGLADDTAKGTLQTLPQVHDRLLWRHSQIFRDTSVHRPRDENGTPLDNVILQEDVFYVFVELCMIYVKTEDINNFANLFLELELVKTCTIYADAIWQMSQNEITAIAVEDITAADLEVVQIIQGWVSRLNLSGANRPLSDENCLSLYRVLQRYALAFVRKYCIFAYSVFGFKVGSNSDDDCNELDKLSKILGIRSVLDIFRCSDMPIDQTKRSLQFKWAQALWKQGNMSTDLKWPLPVTMARLPKSLDELFEKCLTFICRRCKTTPTAPAMCLLCGELVCFQSQCCWDEELNAGECTTHRVECGGSIGLYLLIKRSALLVMRRESGGFGPSPYLDIHGEQDPELRRGKPQFLNERRYEAGIRQLYLQHQIPSWLARKAELYADMGGWETL